MHGVGIDVVGLHGAGMQEAEMRGVDVAFEALQPVAVAHVAHDHALVVGNAQHLERRQRRRHFALAHIDPDDAALLGDLVGLGLDAVGEALVLGQVRLVEAVAFDVELPAVIGAAEAAFLVAAEEHRGAAVRAAVIEDADAALAVAEGDQLLAQELDAHRRGVGLQLPRQAGRHPVFAHQLARRRARPDPGQDVVVLHRQHPAFLLDFVRCSYVGTIIPRGRPDDDSASHVVSKDERA